jgi:iron-sulfur cluster assembly protein
MIQLTDSAVSAVRTALAGSPNPAAGLRIMVQSGGCAGLKYMMGFVETPDPTDVAIEADGVTIYVDAASEPHIAGTTVDFVTALEGSGFSFENPNAASKCSCGKSFG